MGLLPQSNTTGIQPLCNSWLLAKGQNNQGSKLPIAQEETKSQLSEVIVAPRR